MFLFGTLSRKPRTGRTRFGLAAEPQSRVLPMSAKEALGGRCGRARERREPRLGAPAFPDRGGRYQECDDRRNEAKIAADLDQYASDPPEVESEREECEP